jgi:urease accessory protein UreH
VTVICGAAFAEAADFLAAEAAFFAGGMTISLGRFAAGQPAHTDRIRSNNRPAQRPSQFGWRQMSISVISQRCVGTGSPEVGHFQCQMVEASIGIPPALIASKLAPFWPG